MKEEFKPYIPADKVTSEMTPASIIIGIILAVVFGAANAYLGLKVGLTVSASIPAAVISMTVIRIIMKKDSILESNMVQTIAPPGGFEGFGMFGMMGGFPVAPSVSPADTPSASTEEPASDSKKCKFCGADVTWKKFCSECGRKVE